MSVDFAKLTEERLVILVQNTSDGDAFSYLVTQHESALLAFLTRFTGNESHAADLCQETLIKAYTKIKKFTAKSSFKTWLFSIAYNEFRQSHRKAASYSKLMSELEDGSVQAQHEPNIGASLDVQDALNRLSHDERAAVLLSEAIGMTHTEIAKAMGAPLGTVKTYIKRAKDSLYKRLGE